MAEYLVSEHRRKPFQFYHAAEVQYRWMPLSQNWQHSFRPHEAHELADHLSQLIPLGPCACPASSGRERLRFPLTVINILGTS